MRRFQVFLDDDEVFIELPDTASDAECEWECKDALETLIANTCDSGWNEVDADGNIINAHAAVEALRTVKP